MNNTSDCSEIEISETPLSSAQERLWFLSQLDPDSPAYNESLVLRLNGYLSRHSLELALNGIVKRHEPLRTGIAMVDGQPMQFVSPFEPLTLPTLTVPGATCDEREQNIRPLLLQNVTRDFDLRAGKVLRAVLWVIDDRTHILQIVVHHIAADGGSMAIFMAEMAEFYNMFSDGKTHQLPAIISDYRTYSTRQRKYLKGEQAAGSLRYWKTQLAGAPASVDLRLDHPRSSHPAGLGSVISLVLERETLASLKDLCRQNRVTMFMSLLASLAALLWSYTEQTDIVIGCPVSGRNDADFEKLIGCFLNTLVLRLSVDGDLSFRDLLDRARTVVLASLAHQSIPVEHLIQELSPIRHASRQPLFQIIFAYQSIVVAEPKMNGLDVQFLEDQAITSKIDLSFVAGERPQGLLLRCEYDAELFNVGTVERMVTQWGALLKEMVDAPERKIATLATVEGLRAEADDRQGRGLNDEYSSALGRSLGSQNKIEAVLRQQAGVQDAAVLAREDTPGNKRLVAYVVGDVDVAELRSRLSRALPDYMVPEAIVLLNRLPMTINGKLDRQALPQLGSDPAASGGHVAPKTPVEELLCGVWERVLQLDRVDRHDNFFELGGHSLLATQVISQVRRIFSVDVPLRRMFETPTVRGLADAVEEARRRGGQKPEPTLVRVGPRDVVPLSYAQQRLWFLDQLDSGSAVYNIPIAVRLQGPLDVDALEQSIGEIVRRHEVLRTRFEMREGGPVQIVEPELRMGLDRVDLRGEPENELLAHAMATAEASCPFELSRAPLLRCKLLQLGDEDYVLLLTMHHSVSDGWSISVLVKEMTTLYRAYLRGEPSPLPELKVQYADYAVWQRKRLQGKVLEDQLHYWETQLRGLTPLELPADHPRPPVLTHRGDSVPVHLSRDLVTRLKYLARQQDITLFMILLSGFELLLQRYGGQSDITVGTIIANRQQVEWQDLIGYFANTIAIRADLSSCETVEDLFSLTRDLCLGAYANQDLPFERLVDHLNPERVVGRTPLFQTVFVWQNTPVAELNMPDIRWSLIASSNRFVKFDLEFILEERDDELFGSIGYATDLFARETIEEMLGNWTKLLEELTLKSGQRLLDLDTLSSEEKHLLDSWNRTARPVDTEDSLHELCVRSVRLAPDALAVVAQDGTLTYRQLDEESTRMGHLLIDTGIKRGDLVAVYLDRTTSLIAALLAVLKTGAAYVPLDVSYPFERIDFILSSLNIQHLLTTAALLRGLTTTPKSLKHAICLDSQTPCVSIVDGEFQVWGAEDIATRPTHALKSCTQLHDLAYIIFTSGSTGAPKGVMIPHGSVINVIDWLNRTFNVGPHDRILCTASVCFDLSVYDIFGILAAGGVIHLASRSQSSDPDELFGMITSEPITIWDSAPATLQQLSYTFLRSTDSDSLSTLRLVLLSGDWIPTTLPDTIRATCPMARVISLGGATEATIWSNFYPIHIVDPSAPSIPYGVPIQNASYHVLDANLTRCNIGVPGDLYIGGECLAYGYANRSALTASSFIPDPFGLQPGSRLYSTGDRARWHKDGNLEFLGRRDGQVKIRGFRVETGEIESVLLRHLMVNEAVVLAREDSAGDKRLVLYYTGAERSPDELRTELRKKLPEYMVPAAFIHMETMPLTSNGKLDRKTLPVPNDDDRIKRDYEEPEGIVESTIAQLWTEVLNVERVGRQDNFFELGGHSLLAVTLIERMRQIGMEVNVRALFSTSTVAGLATSVSVTRRRSSEIPPNRIPVFSTKRSDLSQVEEVRI